MKSSFVIGLVLYCLFVNNSIAYVRFPVINRESVLFSGKNQENLIIRIAENNDIPPVADFLSEYMFGTNVRQSQKKELSRLQKNDLATRYGELVGKRTLKSALVVAEENGEIIGCAGVDSQGFDKLANKFQKYNSKLDNLTIELVLANLAVKPEQRRRGIASKLTTRCEQLGLDWGFKEINLLVEADNNAARDFYKKLQYKDIFQDDRATRIRAGDGGSNIRTESCTNICMRKDISPKSTKKIDSSTSLNFNNIFSNFFK